MLLTVTCNPSLDRILHIPRLTVGAIHRTAAVESLPSGKGLNVSRAALTLGASVTSTGMLGGRIGQLLADLAETHGLNGNWYWLTGADTRICTLVNHDSSDSTVLNEDGPQISAADWTGFEAHVKRLAEQAGLVVFSGSVPPGLPADALPGLARWLAAAGLPVLVDTSKEPLAAALANPRGLTIKINQFELALGLGLEIEPGNIAAIATAGNVLLARGAAQVVITLGAAGALAISAKGCWRAIAPPVAMVSSVGSGDSLTAGLATALLRGDSLPQALALGVACGSANALTPLPGQIEPAQVEALHRQVRLEAL
ncbi:MAG: 1-phosphofructokinase family hexose kinase [Anaerolineae bacterium]